MTQGQVLGLVLTTILMIGSVAACVSPAARVPCDGKLEPINTPAQKTESSSKRIDPTVSGRSP